MTQIPYVHSLSVGEPEGGYSRRAHIRKVRRHLPYRKAISIRKERRTQCDPHLPNMAGTTAATRSCAASTMSSRRSARYPY